MSELVSFAEFSRRAQVSKQAVNQGVYSGSKILAEAMVGDRIDVTHPVALKYMKDHQTLAEEQALVEEEKHPPLPKYPDDLKDYMNMPFGEVVAEFSTDTRMKVWLDAAEKSEKLRALRFKNFKEENKYIPRVFVADFLFALIDKGYKRVLNDAPKAIVNKVLEHQAKGTPKPAIAEAVSKELSVHLKKTKSEAKKRLEKHDKSNE